MPWIVWLKPVSILTTVPLHCYGSFCFCALKNKGLNMFLIPVNIQTFRFNPSKVFFQLLVPIKFSITIFGPYF